MQLLSGPNFRNYKLLAKEDLNTKLERAAKIFDIPLTELNEDLFEELLQGIASSSDLGPNDRIKIGAGIDSFKGEPCAQAIIYEGNPDELTTTTLDVSQNTFFDIVSIQKYDTLSSFLSIGVSASFGFGFYSGSASFEFMKNTNISKFSSIVCAKVLVHNSAEYIKKLEFNEEAIHLLGEGTEENVGRFFSRFGDCFVFGRQTGGYFYALAEIVSESAEEQREITAAIEGSIGPFSGSGRFSDKLLEVSRKNQVHITYIRNGSSGALPNFDELQKAVFEFPSKVDPETGGRPSLVSVFTQTYRSVNGLPNNIDPSFSESIEILILELEIHAANLYKAWNCLGELEFIAKNKLLFEPFDEEQLDDIIRAVKLDTIRIRQFALKIMTGKAHAGDFQPTRYPNFAVNRRSGTTQPPPPPPAPPNDWISLNVGVGTDTIEQNLGVLIGTVQPRETMVFEARGSFLPHRDLPILSARKSLYGTDGNPLPGYPAIDDKDYKIYLALRRIDNDQFVKLVQYQGTPIQVPATGVKVYAYVGKTFRITSDQNVNNPLQGILYKPL